MRGHRSISAGPDATPYLARLPREENARLTELFGERPPQPVTVYAHATLSEFRSQAGSLVEGSGVRGVWDPREGAIHLSMVDIRDEYSEPRAVFFLEYVHFYVDTSFGLRLPEHMQD